MEQKTLLISKLLNNFENSDIEITKNGSVISFTVKKDIEQKYDLVVDVDLSTTYVTLYFFRFESITFTCKQKENIHYLHTDSFFYNIKENINLGNISSFKVNKPFDSIQEIEELKLDKVKNAELFVNSIKTNELLDFYQKNKNSKIYILDSNSDNMLNKLVLSYKLLKDYKHFIDDLYDYYLFE